MPYSLIILWYERLRFLPAVLAVAFSSMLIATQSGLLLGTLSVSSIPIDHAQADIWVASRDVLSVELGHPIPETWLSRIASQPEIAQAEVYLYGFGYWHKPAGGSELCCVVGAPLEHDSLGALNDLTPEMRGKLTEPGAIVVDESDLDRLGLERGKGEIAEVFNHRVHVVDTVKGLKGIGAPFVFCSLRTARLLLLLFQNRPNQTMYLLARCHHPEDADKVVERLRLFPNMSAFTRADFSRHTQLYWLTRTKAGIAIGFTAGLALLVGLVITSQTLYAATAASMREFAMLQALGIPRWRIASLVLAQSFWIGVAGVILSVPAVFGLAESGETVNVKILLPSWLLAGTALLTMAMSLFSGFSALRSLRLVEPITLLR